METYSSQLDDINEQILEEKKNQIMKQFEEGVQQKTKQTQRLGALKVHVAELTNQLIDEEDYTEVKSTIFEVQEALSDKQETLEKVTANHERLCLEISNLEKKISLLEAVHELVPDGKSISPG